MSDESFWMWVIGLIYVTALWLILLSVVYEAKCEIIAKIEERGKQ